MFASQGFRLTALFATLLMAFSLVAVDTAEARRGGSFGFRGFRTERAIPATPISPKATAPVQRSMTQGTTPRANNVTAAPVRPTLFGGFGGALLGGLLFSGMFGMLFGYGFGGFGGMLALLVQLIIVAFVVNLLFRRRRQPAMAGGSPSASRYEMPNPGAAPGRTASAASRSSASRRAGSRDEIGITDGDLSAFETRLGELQDAYSREDYAALRRISTPEVVSYLAEEIAENATRGQRNEVFNVKLLSGDVAEAWRESSIEFATVAMRYESRDVTRNRATGEIVSGEDSITVTTEVWTFQRQNQALWLVSAIQEA